MLRPASWLALRSRTFTFELSLAGSPRANVEYDYVGKQSIPTTGLSPASPTALWAAEQSLPPSAHAHEAPKALTPRNAHCSANGYELRIKVVAKRGGMAIVSLSFQRL